MSTPTTVFIADDHPIFRKGLREIIEDSADLMVAGEAGDGGEALKMIGELQPAVAVLDVDMPGLSGLEVARRLMDRKLSTRIIILTMHSDPELFDEAMECGVMGYILKENAASDIISAIRSAFSGKYYISPSISGHLVSRSDRTKALQKQNPGLDLLTTTERKILRLIAQNKTSREIAEELSVSKKTVENHRTNIAVKLELRGSHALLKFALENKTLLS